MKGRIMLDSSNCIYVPMYACVQWWALLLKKVMITLLLVTGTGK
jgi:hypothetical protein